MCERMIDVFAGKPDKFTTNLAVAAVMFLSASHVMVTLPLPPDSAFAIGGTSFDVRRSAVNVAMLEIVGAVDEVPPPQPAATSASARVEMVRRFIVFGSFVVRRTACELNPRYTGAGVVSGDEKSSGARSGPAASGGKRGWKSHIWLPGS